MFTVASHLKFLISHLRSVLCNTVACVWFFNIHGAQYFIVTEISERKSIKSINFLCIFLKADVCVCVLSMAAV